jgi:hypothetical protein
VEAPVVSAPDEEHVVQDYHHQDFAVTNLVDEHNIQRMAKQRFLVKEILDLGFDQNAFT